MRKHIWLKWNPLTLKWRVYFDKFNRLIFEPDTYKEAFFFVKYAADIDEEFVRTYLING